MKHDPRITPARADIAAAHLQGVIAAQRYVAGRAMRLIANTAPVQRHPSPDAPTDTQLLFGETFTVYEDKDGWSWGQAALDDYVGYAPSAALAPPGAPPTHSVAVPRTFVYRDADIKSPPLIWLSMNSQVAVSERDGNFSRLDNQGWVYSAHLAKPGETAKDFVAVAESFLGTPYLWAGKDSLGLDCSGLVQTAMQRAGLGCPRDSDMQAELGAPVAIDFNAIRRGDLVFWKGHVAIIQNANNLLHANAHCMQVTSEPIASALVRIEKAAGPVTAIRRLAKPGA